MILSKIRETLNKLMEGGGVCVELTEPQQFPAEKSSEELEEEEESELQSEKLSDKIYKTSVVDGQARRYKNNFEPDIEKVTDVGNKVDLAKARLTAHTKQADSKRKKSMRVRDLLVREDITSEE